MNSATALLHFGNTIPANLLAEDGKSPDWLLTSYDSLEWRVKDIGAQRARTIHWDLPLGHHGRLLDYPNLLESTKRIVYGLRTGPLATLESGAQQYNCAQAFFCLIRWMLDRGRTSFSELTKRDIQDYKAGCVRGVEFLLNAQGRLQQLVESMVLAAGFEEGETRQERIAKSVLAFPHRANGGQFRLKRDDMLEMAGLKSLSSKLSPILDALERDCGFYLNPSQVQRLESSLQAKTQAEAELDDNDDDEEEDDDGVKSLPLDTVTKDRAGMLLSSLAQLYAHRRFLDDALPFHPFAQIPLRKVLNSMGLRDVGRTPTAPTKQTITYIERAARWVLNYSRPLLALQKWAQMHEHEPTWTLQKLIVRKSPSASGPASPFPIVHRGRDFSDEPMTDITASAVALRQGMSLRTALTFLQTACVVVIAAFTARRAAEIRGLEVGCIERDETTRKPWLRVFIHKTLKDYALIPVPEIVVKAVQVLTRLSASARSESGAKYLLQIVIPGAKEVIGINPHGEPVARLASNVERFGYFCDVPPVDDAGTRWAFAPHQFRRFFAVMYIWAYDYGDIDALSWHLRHWNREQTRRYCTESQVGREVTSANRERAAEVLSAAALGEVKFDGHPRLARAVEHMCHRMARKVQVVTRRQLEARTLRLLERSKASLHAFPWGYCVSTGDGQESSSRCNRGGTEPKLDQASMATCSGCSKAMRGSAHRIFLFGALKTHKGLAQDSKCVPMVREASAAMVAVLEEVTAEGA